MANLYGKLTGNRGMATRVGSSTITSKLETWNGSVTTTLHKDGTFTVSIGVKTATGEDIIQGNVDTLEVSRVWRQTACSKCKQDVEGNFVDGDWRDRGGNATCSDGHHIPYMEGR